MKEGAPSSSRLSEARGWEELGAADEDPRSPARGEDQEGGAGLKGCPRCERSIPPTMRGPYPTRIRGGGRSI